MSLTSRHAFGGDPEIHFAAGGLSTTRGPNRWIQMARVIRQEVRAADLPKKWQARLDAAPDEIVRVTVDARRRRDVRALLRLSEQASAEARRRGLSSRSLIDIDAWLAEMDGFADVPFMEDGRRQPPMPEAEEPV